MSDEPDDWGDKRLDEMFERAAAPRDDAPRPSIVPPATRQSAPPLADVLDFEAQIHGLPGQKQERIRTLFGLSNTRYHQILNRYINTREALELNPMLVKRLITQRDRRTAARASRTFGNRNT
ncbi:MAG: DUF3263 domain-containing protein [Rhodoglobus sp.]